MCSVESPLKQFLDVPPAVEFVRAAIRAGLDEDGPDLTSQALFSPGDRLTAQIVAKAHGVVAGLVLAEKVLAEVEPDGDWQVELLHQDGDRVTPGALLARIEGKALTLLAVERPFLNLLGHMSGIASLTRRYADELQNTRTTLLDTRKTLPGLRHLEKYAVCMGGGANHRMNLHDMLMLKDNHIDRAGSITKAVTAVQTAYNPCPPLVVECRTLEHVDEAVGLGRAMGVTRLLLDNMDLTILEAALARITEDIESEASGGVTLETIAAIARLGPDFVPVGALTHSAPALDVSMRL
jgi:nicotinate-nucleotide pyrophosphorylase (carboxylating)